MVNLQDFCADNYDHREWIQKPFSIGECSYATNGHIAVRVSRQLEFPELEREHVKRVQKVFGELSSVKRYKAFPSYRFPRAGKTKVCVQCEGTGSNLFDGVEHECSLCEGAGHIDFFDLKHSVDVLGKPFGLRYMRKIRKLPSVQVAMIKSARIEPRYMLAFRFKGGHGLLMPLRNKAETHITPLS